MFEVAITDLSAAEATVAGAAISAVVAAAVAISLNAAARRRDERARRRDLYSNAYRAALEWCEGVYRVRRRRPDGSQDYELVAHFHELQERIAYFEGWLAIESAKLGAAYCALLNAVMNECRPLLQSAWERDGRPPTDPTPNGDPIPDISSAKETFTRAVHDHLKPWWKF